MDRVLVLIVEAALELVPRELWGFSDVRAHARRRGVDPGRMLLDISYHYRAMRERLADWYRRGRPDIVHTTLLTIMSSPLWLRGLVDVAVETRHGVVAFRRGVRIPRSYDRFCGLMAQVLYEGSAPPGSSDPLIVLHRGVDALEYLSRASVDRVFLLDEGGRRVDLFSLARSIAGCRYPAILLGGFQRGSFSSRIYSAGFDRVSIYPEPLDAWSVICRVLTFIEGVIGLI